MLPLVTTRPATMTEQDWEWLNNLPFGAVLFANPTPGMKSLPPSVADGDLDGDLYFVCWDTTILSFLMAEPVVQEPIDEPVSEAASTGSSNTNDDNDNNHPWLAQGQQVLIQNALQEGDLCRLQGKLYTLSEKVAHCSPLGVADPAANAYGKAFKQVLDYPKHRRPIALEAHLVHDVPVEKGLHPKRDKIPMKLHKYLSIIPSNTSTNTTNHGGGSSGGDEEFDEPDT